jgi:hypothetical protein
MFMAGDTVIPHEEEAKPILWDGQVYAYGEGNLDIRLSGVTFTFTGVPK